MHDKNMIFITVASGNKTYTCVYYHNAKSAKNNKASSNLINVWVLIYSYKKEWLKK